MQETKSNKLKVIQQVTQIQMFDCDKCSENEINRFLLAHPDAELIFISNHKIIYKYLKLINGIS